MRRGSMVSFAGDSDELKRVIPHLRKVMLASVLRGPVLGREVQLGSENGLSSTWLHRPEGAEGPLPTVFELHGGGFAQGDARKEDALCEWIKDGFGVNVVGVNYRLAPEHPWPAALEDVLRTLAFYAHEADRFGVDSQAFYLMGCSAGANLAVAACLAAPQDAPYRIRGCLLNYPFLDATSTPDDSFRDVDLPKDLAAAFNSWYVGDADPANPLISPALASDEQLARMPATVLCPVAGDALCGSAVRFRDRLSVCGVPCSLHIVEGTYHGYVEACPKRWHRDPKAVLPSLRGSFAPAGKSFWAVR